MNANCRNIFEKRKTKYKDCKFYLQYLTVKDKILQFKCLNCKKNCEKEFDEDLKKRFANTCKFCQGGINKLILILQKGVYPYEHTNDWEKLNATSSVTQKKFYNSLNMESITDLVNKYAKTVRIDFEIKNIGGCNDLKVESNTWLLAEISERSEIIILRYRGFILLIFFQYQD